MPYLIRQWPPSIQRKEIDALPTDAVVAVMVLLKAMQERGPFLDEYKTKRLSGHLRGIVQINLKINREQIRVLYSVHGQQIVILHVFKKTSPQVETRGYELALTRKATAETILKDKANGVVVAIH